jgi:hypothetical protein
MELSPSWEAASRTATQEFPILRNPKVHCRAHKSSPLVPILSQINRVHTAPSYLSKIIFSLLSLFWKNKVGLWDYVAVCVYPPLSLLGNGSVETLSR